MKTHYLYSLAVLCILSLFISFHVKAEYNFQLDMDSLEKSLSIEKTGDNKIQDLLLLSKEYRKTNLDQALVFASEAVSLTEKQPIVKGVEIDALHELSLVYKEMGKFDSSLNVSKRAINKSELINDLKRLADNTITCGSNYYRLEGPLAAKPFYIDGLRIYQQLGDSLGMANALNGIGAVYMRLVQYDSAIYYYQQVIRISEQIGYLEGPAKAYINIGIAYSDLQEYDKSRSYLLESIVINEELNNTRFIALAYNNLGSVAYDEKNMTNHFHSIYRL